jgi:hypothetical protein
MLTSAPVAASAFVGSSSSDCSKPSVARTATRMCKRGVLIAQSFRGRKGGRTGERLTAMVQTVLDAICTTMKKYLLPTVAATVLIIGSAISQAPSRTGPISPGPGAPTPGVEGIPQSAEGFFVRNGIAYGVRNGQITRVTKEAALRVTPTRIVGFDGMELVLPPGMMLSVDGRHVPIPSGVNPSDVPPIEPGATDPAQPGAAPTNPVPIPGSPGPNTAKPEKPLSAVH